MRDIQLAIRSARRRPLLAGIIILTLALGLSLTTIVFSIADRVLFRELPYANPTKLVALSTVLAERPDQRTSLAAAVLTRVAAEVPAFAGVGALRGASLVVAGRDGPTAIQGSAVTPNLFGVLGIRPVIGPGFTPTPLTQPARTEIVLSHALWQTMFDGDPAIVGRSIAIAGVPHTVVGVLPANTVFPIATAEAWTPLDLTPFLADEQRSRRQRFFSVIARLAPGATVTSAQAELSVVASRLATALPNYHGNQALQVRPLRDQIVGTAEARVRLLLYAGVLLLVVACANAASVLWAQVITRRGEFAVRAALGAGRGQLARQLTTEGLVLGVAGGALGIALAPLVAVVLRPMTSPFLPAVGLPGIDARVLAVAGATCLACGLLLGLFPALFVGRGPLVLALRNMGRSGGLGNADGRVRGLLLVVQTSFCVALLVSAGLLLKSLTQLHRVELGFDSSRMLVFELSLPGSRYSTEEAVEQFYQALESELAALPGVTGATTASGVPMVGGTMASVGIEGRSTPPGQLPQSAYFSVGETYFSLFRVPVIQGRLVDPRSPEPEFVVNETMARHFWPNGDAVGARIRIGPVQTGPWARVVGIVGDIRDGGPADTVRAIAFGANRHYPFSSRAIALRSAGEPASHATAVRRTVNRVDPSLAIMRMRTFEDVRRADLERERVSAILLTLFAGGALVLALVGIYGLTASFVAARSREFGIRLALGAPHHRVLGDAMRRGIRLTAIGLVVGLAASAMVARLFASLIYGVRSYDPAVYFGVSLALGVTTVVATWLPSRRATHVDPAIALRSD
ncbi:MAG: permease [Geminicoccaceae bacterium]|jgi:predicted permease|nr:permease [Geminicoccaceae bacterium]